MKMANKALLALTLTLLAALPVKAESYGDGQSDARTEESIEAPSSAPGDEAVTTRALRQLAPSGGMLQVPKPGTPIAPLGQAPANVTLAAILPNVIRVEWSPSPNALRYVIRRNGGPDITVEASSVALQGNRYVFTDIGRAPAMLHTYSVTAIYNAPYVPGRSAPVQVVTPPLLPPRNLKASVTSPNTISLSWTPIGDGIEYHILRNTVLAGTEARADFFVNGTGHYIDQNVSAGQHTYTVTARLKLPNGVIASGEPSSLVSLNLRPFNVLAVGDSVMWGQGLRRENKFATKIQGWLQGVLRKQVNLYHEGLAHSGAQIFPPDPKKENTSFPGEMPYDYPSITHQVRELAQKQVAPDDVDLVLVDGCINDVKVQEIINPLGSDEELSQRIQTFCHTGAEALLQDVATKFKNAKVVVTGYFPIISWQSDLAFLTMLWPFVTPAVTAVPVVGSLLQASFLAFPVVGIAAGAGGTALFRESAVRRSDIFSRESTSALESAVRKMNSVAGDRFRYAGIPAGPQNAYAAPDSWLWLIPTPVSPKDEVYDQRSTACRTYYTHEGDTPSLFDPTCHGASMGHPNIKGAQAYTDAIKSSLAAFIAEWQRVHIGPAMAQDDTFTLRVQPGPTSPSGGTLTVTALDGTNTPLPGTVHVDGVLAGPVGTSVRYTFGQNNPTDVRVVIYVPGRRHGYFIIPIRSLTISVNVSNNGDQRTATVTSTDAISGQSISGTVKINPNTPREVVGQTGQPLTYASCGTIEQTSLRSFGLEAGPAPCVGFVFAPYYPATSFLDQSQGWTVKRPQLKRSTSISTQSLTR